MAAGAGEERHAKHPERENVGQRMKGRQHQAHTDRGRGSHATDEGKRERENPTACDTNEGLENRWP